MQTYNDAAVNSVAFNYRPSEDGRWVGLSKNGLCHKGVEPPEFIPQWKIGSNAVTRYYERVNPKARKATKPPESSVAKGELSPSAQRNIKKILSAWDLNQKVLYDAGEVDRRKLIVVTLTLQAMQRHTDDKIKRGPFRAFVQWLINNNYKNYLHKEEAQSNGNIHFHLVLDKYLDKDKLQDKWNNLMEKFGGYVSEFESKHGHRYPNSTDIGEARNEDGVVEYCAKYVAKNEPDKRTISGRVWGRSESVAQFSRPTFQQTEQVDQFAHYLEENAKKVESEDGFFLTYYANMVDILQIRFPLIFQEVYLECKRQRELSEQMFVTPP